MAMAIRCVSMCGDPSLLSSLGRATSQEDDSSLAASAPRLTAHTDASPAIKSARDPSLLSSLGRIGAAALCLALVGCNHLFYFPDKTLYVDPSEYKIKYNKTQLPLPDGTSISLWHFPAERSETGCKSQNKKLVLHFHGNAQNVSTHFGQLYWLSKQNIDYVIWDYPGYGESGGDANRKSIHNATMTLLDALHDGSIGQFQNHQLYLYAQSLGGAILLGALPDLKSKKNIQRIFIESSFISYRRIGKNKLASTWVTWPLQWLAYLAISDNHSGYNKLSGLSLPKTIVLHGTADTVVPFEEGQFLFQQLPEPKEFWAIDGGQHLGLLNANTKTPERLLKEICEN
jgi:alpha-beta hydrolase superfamily lysophospholipase